MVTGAVRFIVPLLKTTVSVAAGTLAGVQLFVLNQSLLTEPFQVTVALKARGRRRPRHASVANFKQIFTLISPAEAIAALDFLLK
jgi:hypothetical protein